MCGSITYYVTLLPDNQIQFFETCVKKSNTKIMNGTPNSQGTSLSYHTGPIKHGVQAGMTSFWKKDGAVVSASVRHPLLHGKLNTIRPLWFKKGVVFSIEEEARITLQHSWTKNAQ